MKAIPVSTGIIALSEIGYKTQLLAIILAARFRKLASIIPENLDEALINHAFFPVFSGITFGYMATHIPPVFPGNKITL